MKDRNRLLLFCFVLPLDENELDFEKVNDSNVFSWETDDTVVIKTECLKDAKKVTFRTGYFAVEKVRFPPF